MLMRVAQLLTHSRIGIVFHMEVQKGLQAPTAAHLLKLVNQQTHKTHDFCEDS